MSTFWDLPEDVRGTIYRLHLVQAEPISVDQHELYVKCEDFYEAGKSKRCTPPICELSRQAEKEAAPIYYGENSFKFGNGSLEDGSYSGIFRFMMSTRPRHVRLIRSVIFDWTSYGGSAQETFHEIRRMKGLQELNIRVDEQAMVNRTLSARYHRQDYDCKDPSPQQQLTILRHPGMTGLLSLSGIPSVRFTKKTRAGGAEYGGPIAGSILETQIAPRLMGLHTAQTSHR